MILRPHQEKAIEDITAHVEMFGTEDMFLWAPPAFGKSLVLSTLAKELDGTTVIMVNISDLLQQIADHLDEIGVDYSILKAGRESEFNESHKVHLVMSQTYYARADKLNIECDNLLIDEGHREFSSARTTKLISSLKPDRVIRVSGTPWDSEGFRFKKSELIETISVQELQDQGYLAPIKYLVPKWSETIDYSGISTSGGDYNTTQLDEKINTNSHLVKSIEAMNHCDAKNKKTLIFCSSIEQCDKFAEMLRADGYYAQAYHSKIDKKLNKAIMDAFKNDTTFDPSAYLTDNNTPSLFEDQQTNKVPVNALLSIAKLGIGFDCPSVTFGVMMRKTNVYSLFIQQTMRLARTNPGKELAELLDLSQNVSTFGFHTDHYNPPSRSGNLDNDKKLIAELKQSQGMPNLDLALESDEPSEIDVNKYSVIIKELKEKEQKLRDKKADITNWSMKELASAYDITNDFSVVLKIGAEIMTRKFGRPISKKGFEYDYDPEWLGELIEPVIERYPEVKLRFLKAMKTRTRNVIREGKNFNGLRFFITFLADRYAEEIAPIYNQEEDDIEDYTGVSQPDALDIDESEIPF